MNNLEKIIKDSEIADSHDDCDKFKIHILYAAFLKYMERLDTVKHSDDVLSIELNSVTDNPLVFPEDKVVLSGGNFHGEAGPIDGLSSHGRF